MTINDLDIGPPLTQNIVSTHEIIAAEAFLFSQELARVFSRIKAHLSENKSLVLYIAAAMSGEGTSTIARALAHAASQAAWCNVLLIDTHFTDNNQFRHFGVPPFPDIAQGAHDRGGIDLALIDCGPHQFKLAQLALNGPHSAPSQIRSLYENLRKTFALTIIDCPPIMTAPETAALSPYADDLLLVIEAEKTRIPVVMRAKDYIEKAGGSIHGVIMNKRKFYIPKIFYRNL